MIDQYTPWFTFPPPEGTTTLFCREHGKLARLTVETPDHAHAIYSARQQLGHKRINKVRYVEGPLLALIE